MIHAIANQYNISIPESNILDLDYMNGWGDSTHRFITELQPYRLKNEGGSKTIGECLRECTLKFKDSITDEVVTIVYKIDSGD